ncbi:metalloprotease secretion chaperone CpaB [Aquirhabdus sp.]|uniref:metalloprotease secretion chaperone CpaB n=1 Tax=Aquirhabdus sp. TaxID=2824160 RepID=UPI00396C911F
MNKRLLISLIAIGIVVVGVVVWLKPTTLPTAAASIGSIGSHTTQIPTSLSPDNPPLSDADIKQRVKKAIVRRQFVHLDVARLEQAAANIAMFKPSDADTVAANNPIQLSDALKNDGRAYISYDPYTLEGKGVGDRVQFNVPAIGINRSAVIDQVKVDAHDDIVSWTGHLENGDQNNENFYISQTIKDDFTVGTITTLNGTYNLKIKNSVGWVAQSGSEKDFGEDEVTSPSPK